MENCRKRRGEVEEVDDDPEIQQQQQQHGRPGRSTAARKQQQQQWNGRPGRSTVVHNEVVAVDRPVDRLKVPNSRLGTVDRHGRPVPRSVDRTVDRQSGRAVSGKC